MSTTSTEKESPAMSTVTVTVADDRRRVVEIDKYLVLTRPPRKDLLALVEIAAQVAAVPMATINLITETEQHQIAAHGFDAAVCAREDSMCNLVLNVGHPVVVADARRDPRFCDNPFVTGQIGHVRFYASHQLVTPQGVVIGTLCVFDVEPRVLDEDRVRSLSALADRVVDLLELELRTRELERAQQELERSNEQLTAFAGQVSHDLLNPLTAVSMSLRLVQEQLAEPGGGESKVPWLLERAVGGAERMQSLIDDLLAFARIGGRLSRVPLALDDLVRDVREDLATVLEAATVDVGDLPRVVGDPVQLRAVLQNLVANAANFTRPGEPARIAISAERRHGWWRLQVVDHGIGVPPEDRERVFEPLARVDHGVAGSGIGLATVRRVIEAHAGRIGLTETPGGGTTVWFDLPD
jgi:signal transduction histidine kinase